MRAAACERESANWQVPAFVRKRSVKSQMILNRDYIDQISARRMTRPKTPVGE
jgi:hypothetical protein